MDKGNEPVWTFFGKEVVSFSQFFAGVLYGWLLSVFNILQELKNISYFLYIFKYCISLPPFSYVLLNKKEKN